MVPVLLVVLGSDERAERSSGNQSLVTMNRASVYHSHSGILGGTPVFTGTRVPVDSLVHHLRTGSTLDAFLDDFPSVSREQAEAFLALALNDALDLTPQDAEAVA